MTKPKKPTSPAKPKPDAAPEPKFEEHLENVETAIRRLESGDIPLEDSIDLYASAMQHLAACHAVLERAEARLEIVRRDAAGDPAAVPAELREGDGVVESDG